MAATFVGRVRDMADLDKELAATRTSTGRFVSMRGRRQVGKSRLLQEWADRTGIGYVFFTAKQGTRAEELAAFAADLARSNLPVAPEIAAGLRFDSWEAALTVVAGRATPERPTVIILDEFPYLVATDSSIEAELQKVWSRALENKPVLLVLVGSDITVMEALTTYGHPLYQRATREMVIDPLNPRELGELIKISGPAIFDAYLMVGGFPGVVRDWAPGTTPEQFLRDQLSRDNSALVVTGERVLDAELPGQLQARALLEAIGLGERTFSTIQRRAGLDAMTMTRSLDALAKQKRLVATRQPYSTEAAKEPRYLVADDYLRFWLHFINDARPEISRGRGQVVAERILGSWQSYAGHAVEPLVRRSIEHMLPDPRFGAAKYAGGWWNRTNSIEIDLVGGDASPVAKTIEFVGSIKWHLKQPFDGKDLATLRADASSVPGVHGGVRLVAVSRSGFSAHADIELGLEELLAALP